MTALRMEVTVRGIPAPQGSKRHVGNGVMVEMSKRLKPWREAVRSAVEASGIVAMLDEPVRVQFVFTFVRPKSHFRTGANAARLRDAAPSAPQGMPDLSKLIRSTEDALTDAGVWRDDSRVVTIHAAKVYAGEHPDSLNSPGAVIRVWTASDGMETK